MLYILIYAHGALSGFAGPLPYDIGTCRERVAEIVRRMPLSNPEGLDQRTVRMECRVLQRAPRVSL